LAKVEEGKPHGKCRWKKGAKLRRTLSIPPFYDESSVKAPGFL